MVVQEKVREETVKWIWERPLTFDQFVEMFGKEDLVELIDGVVVEREMVQLEHEKLEFWLKVVLHLYTKSRDLGIVLGSRTAVQISQFRGRLPDLLFIRKEQMGILQQKGVYGPPDFIIEVISPGDRASTIVSLESDYRTVGTSEIVFIDQRRHRVRILRKRESDYVEEIVTSGTVTFETMTGMVLQTEWLFEEPRPDERAVVDALLAAADGTPNPECAPTPGPV